MSGEPTDLEAGDRHVIFISAGEPSGDLHGAALARALRDRLPASRLIGLGGPRMAAEGVELLADLKDLAVMGFAEVLSRLPYFLRLRKKVFDTLEAERVDLVIPIDYPGFNLRLARRARGMGVAVLYYIAPQVWAWHASRARDLARDTDRVAVILPFEEDFLRESGAAVEFVGHPLLDQDGAAGPLGQLGDEFDPDRPTLALFPGSRFQEVQRHLGVFSATADILRRRAPELQVLIGAPSDIPDDAYAGSPYRVTRSSAALLRQATAALVKSGTTTLEAALAETPFVVAYRMNPLTFQLARRMVRVPHIALANLVAGRRVVPEFVQGAATPEALAGALAPLLDRDSAQRAAMITELREVRSALRGGGAGERVAAMAAELLETRGK
ncbi:MAG: lipid-A-disaccharide synthase [Gemmatimonadota bacterium]